MSRSSLSANANSVRPRLSVVVAGVLFVVFVTAFLAMQWIRSRQEHRSELYPSEIEALVKHHKLRDPLVEAHQRGRKVYTHYCVICHGEEGNGSGFNSSQLKQPPRDFTNREFWKGTTEERVYFAITKGGPSVGKSVLMPAWGKTLTERQIREVMAFLRTFAGTQEPQQN